MANIPLISFLVLKLIVSTVSVTPPNNATDYILLNCGSPSAEESDSDGRKWGTDIHYPNFLSSSSSRVSIPSIASEQDPSVSRVPYMTARIIKSLFTYTFSVCPGPKFLRLYFYAANYQGFNKSDSFFSVMANQYTLLSNFSAFLTATAQSALVIRKEYVINVDETQRLNVTFSPSPNSYAFVNGIEIVSMPTNLYIRGEDNDVKLVGHRNSFIINNSTALETLYRFNVGGSQVPSTKDTGMFRIWAAGDENFTVGCCYQTPYLDDVNVTYSQTLPSVAPSIVYTTSRRLSNNSTSLEWSFPVDTGFYYLFRLHICVFPAEEYEVGLCYVSIGNQTADIQADAISSGRLGAPVYFDYVMLMSDSDGRRSKQNVLLHLRPSKDAVPVYDNVSLNGLEIFKLSDSNGNLAVPNPELHLQEPVVSPSPDKKKKSSHVVVFIIAGVIGGICVIYILCFFIVRHRKRWNGSSNGTILTKIGGSSSLPSNLCTHFLLEEVKAATSNFDENLLIGHGGFGNVYKGYIDNGTTIVAVKRMNSLSKQGVREFETEIEMLSKLRHLHLVSLIGYCDDNSEMILVYDYMSHGTLRDHLYKTENAPLPWKKRLEICIGAAKGLYYLHTATKHTIIHRDVKSTNILLDSKWVAKVSDFGLSKVGPLSGTDDTHVTTAVKGSFGYLDPEYYKRQLLTEKSDVYSFGVVLFEVLCGRPAIIPNLPMEEINLAEWACKCCEKGDLDRIIDPNLEGQIAPECLSKFAEVAYSCLRDQGVKRPSMRDVVSTLELALQLQVAVDNKGDGMVKVCTSSTLNISGHAKISTDEGEAFTSEVQLNSNGNDTSVATLYSTEMMNPSGR